MLRFEKNCIKAEIKLYEEYPTAYNTYIANLLRREINEPYNKDFIFKYGRYIHKVQCSGNRKPDYAETVKEFNERWAKDGN